jgi:hypothetical protein
MSTKPKNEPHNLLSLRRSHLPYCLVLTDKNSGKRHNGLLLNRDYRPLFDPSRSMGESEEDLLDMCVSLTAHPVQMSGVWWNEANLTGDEIAFYFYHDGETDPEIIHKRTVNFLGYVCKREHWSERRS